jgi:hypothetical protein
MSSFRDTSLCDRIIASNDVCREISWIAEPGIMKIRVEFMQPLHILFRLAQLLARAYVCTLLAGI